MSSEANVLQRRGLLTWLFNPFYYLAGGAALTLGLVIVIATSLIGSLSNSHFDGVLDFHTGASVPWWMFPAEGLVDWLAMGIAALVIGKIMSTSSVRAIDVFGTQALARTPSLLTAASALLPGYGRFLDTLNKHVMQQIASPGAKSISLLPPDMNAMDLIQFSFAIFVMLIVIVWMVALMYRAFAVSCNLRGGRSAVGFIVGIIAAEIASKIVIIVMLKFGLA